MEEAAWVKIVQWQIQRGFRGFEFSLFHFHGEFGEKSSVNLLNYYFIIYILPPSQKI